VRRLAKPNHFSGHGKMRRRYCSLPASALREIPILRVRVVVLLVASGLDTVGCCASSPRNF